MLFVIIIGFMLVSFVVQTRLKNRFKKYGQIPMAKGLSGAEMATVMLRDHGIGDVGITCVGGNLTDHYDPSTNSVNLSHGVYHGRSILATAIAAHECGHAIQKSLSYRPLALRSALVPIQNFSGRLMNIIFVSMLLGAFALPGLIPYNLAILIIIGCYSVFTFFAFITLPVEFDASRRALAWVNDRGIVTGEELEISKKSLNLAATTYVVVALGSLATLLYYLTAFLGLD